MSNFLMYTIYWRELVIGKIYKKEDLFKYYPNYDNIEEAVKTGLPRAFVITPQLEWGEMPTFFKNRLEKDPNCQNFCRSNADHLTIKKEGGCINNINKEK